MLQRWTAYVCPLTRRARSRSRAGARGAAHPHRRGQPGKPEGAAEGAAARAARRAPQGRQQRLRGAAGARRPRPGRPNPTPGARAAPLLQCGGTWLRRRLQLCAQATHACRGLQWEGVLRACWKGEAGERGEDGRCVPGCQRAEACGALRVQELDAAAYDLVFMDIHMPVRPSFWRSLEVPQSS